MERYKKIIQYLIYYTLIVIIWGAWVRISHSGDGCGDTWPLCNGQLIPEAEQKKTWVEFSHRITSGLFGIFVVVVWWQARSLFEKSHPARFWALLSLLFTISEALLGAKLVLFGLVGSNDTPFRAIVMSMHLINSLFLVGSLTLLWDACQNKPWTLRTQIPWNLPALSSRRIAISFASVFMMVGITGAIAALSTTLFPSDSLIEGLKQDFSTDGHFLIRLRVLHPIMALTLGGGLILILHLLKQITDPKDSELLRRTKYLQLTLLAAILMGGLTLLKLSPTHMKIIHLISVHTAWIFLVLWLRSVLRQK